MLTGRPPFYGESDSDVIQKVKIGKYPKQSNSLNLISEFYLVLNEKKISKEA
jgi:hypothetical protein